MNKKLKGMILKMAGGKNMIILGISGTPRKGGNSEILLDAALEPFEDAEWEIRKVLLSENNIQPCIGCEYCVQNMSCSIENDDMKKFYEVFEICDAVIVSAPTYWRNVPAQLKAVFDRTYGLKNRPLEGKLGGAISVGRGAGGGQSIVLNIIHNFYLSNGMLCVPGELNGITAVADKPGDILRQPRRLEQARILGRNIIKYRK
jgi:multimeric flavodoxin WrbA